MPVDFGLKRLGDEVSHDIAQDAIINDGGTEFVVVTESPNYAPQDTVAAHWPHAGQARGKRSAQDKRWQGHP